MESVMISDEWIKKAIEAEAEARKNGGGYFHFPANMPNQMQVVSDTLKTNPHAILLIEMTPPSDEERRKISDAVEKLMGPPPGYDPKSSGRSIFLATMNHTF